MITATEATAQAQRNKRRRAREDSVRQIQRFNANIVEYIGKTESAINAAVARGECKAEVKFPLLLGGNGIVAKVKAHVEQSGYAVNVTHCSNPYYPYKTELLITWGAERQEAPVEKPTKQLSWAWGEKIIVPVLDNVSKFVGGLWQDKIYQ